MGQEQTHTFSPEPPQHQDQPPVIGSEMTPRPQAKDRSYRGSGKLQDNVAIITGGDSRIGRAVAIAFAKEGADVAIIYLNEHGDGQEPRALVEKEGRRCLALADDVDVEWHHAPALGLRSLVHGRLHRYRSTTLNPLRSLPRRANLGGLNALLWTDSLAVERFTWRRRI